MREVIRAYQDACSGVVARYDGFVAKFMGDGMLAYFGYPRAHEDDAERAVRAGLEIVGGRRPAGDARASEPLAVRIGIATGLVVVGDLVGEGSAQEQAVVGDTPNLAARLQALAEPGSVVVAAATRRLLGGLFRLRDLGRHDAQGLRRAGRSLGGRGRRREREPLRGGACRAAHRLRRPRGGERAAAATGSARPGDGDGQIVLISGEAGIGKSRLAAWLADQVANGPHTRLRYQCSPYHRDSALAPLRRGSCGRAAGFAPRTPAETQLDKLEAMLAPARIAETSRRCLLPCCRSRPVTAIPPLALSAGAAAAPDPGGAARPARRHWRGKSRS